MHHTDHRRAHIAFLSIPAHGHVNPGLGLVEALAERGHRTTYANTAEFTSIVSSAGATPVPYTSLLPSPSDPQQSWPDDPAAAQSLFLDEAMSVVPQLERSYAGDRPDLIVYDPAAFHALVLGAKWDVPLVQVSPTHVYSAALAEQFLPITTGPEMAAVQRRFEDYFAEQGTDLSYVDISVPRRGIVTIPRAFQYFGDQVPEQFTFVGPMLTDRAFQGGWQRPDDRPVLVVSLGSAYNRRADFYRRCLRAFADLDWHVLMSVGRGVQPADLGPIPANIEVRQWIPQLAALGSASAFVTHAGMGGVTEGFYHGVPLVAVPQAADQFMNADRITELGLGERADADAVEPEQLREQVLRVAADPVIRANCTRIRDEVRQAGGVDRAVRIVEDELRSAGRT
ncbi:OleI family self-immunity macrolide glycosyltransferase [Saccharopolyspora sp. HNM0983]|uniref:OleI family self-immunity macrolide glycosyltransferase n=1 Tax=Saccharopolyspora montiporae TaxID=2781240 RepID=A0A929BBT1_9PSEU|nr:macrolide family glycosyltransferase [Saccharopolyspora sp. HNM0983]MBE9375178.1 OleI family self-immunity macrolide glycosyltransferase [Saccharopolyspora sp. HNM0983]